MANAAEMMTALGDPTRQAIFDRLSDGPRPVGELAADLPISRPAVSQHLKALLDSNLVSVTSEGTRRIYAVNNRGFDKLNLWLDQFWA
jgi:DNA-binding transcriptional ArsR family regulator